MINETRGIATQMNAKKSAKQKCESTNEKIKSFVFLSFIRSNRIPPSTLPLCISALVFRFGFGRYARSLQFSFPLEFLTRHTRSTLLETWVRFNYPRNGNPPQNLLYAVMLGILCAHFFFFILSTIIICCTMWNVMTDLSKRTPPPKNRIYALSFFRPIQSKRWPCGCSLFNILFSFLCRFF